MLESNELAELERDQPRPQRRDLDDEADARYEEDRQARTDYYAQKNAQSQ